MAPIGFFSFEVSFVCIFFCVCVWEALSCLGPQNSGPFGPYLLGTIKYSGPFPQGHNAAQYHLLQLARVYLGPIQNPCLFLFQRQTFTQNRNRHFFFCAAFPAYGDFHLSHFMQHVPQVGVPRQEPNQQSAMLPVHLVYELYIPVGWSFQAVFASPLIITGSPFSLFLFVFQFLILDLQQLKGSDRKDSRPMGLVFALSLASLYAALFYPMPLCPGIHVMVTKFFSVSCVSFSIPSATSIVFALFAARAVITD